MKMLKFLLIHLVGFVFALSVTLPSWACDAVGPSRHVGVVTKIDPKAGTFTILDAQMRKPMTFIAEKTILDALKLNSNFMITFREEGQGMMAEAALPAS